MAVREVKISSAMSLDDKVRVIRAYAKMSADQKINFRKSHKQIQNITKNRRKILKQHLLMRTKDKDVKHVSDLHLSMQDVKIWFLEKIMYEWFQRFRSYVTVKYITFEIFKEKVEVAMNILNIKLFALSDLWIANLRLTCTKGYPSRRYTLDLKEIAMHVLKKEGISREKAESTYGIYVYEDEPSSVSDHLDCISTEGVQKSELIIDDGDCNDGDMVTSYQLLELNKGRGKASTSVKVRLKDVQPIEDNNVASECLEHTGDTPTTSKNSPEVCELIGDSEGFFVYLVHDDNKPRSAKCSQEACEFVEDNKDTLEYLKYDDAAASASICMKHDQLIKNNEDALLYLEPLRKFLLSLDNGLGLELLTQMEANLVKSEKPNTKVSV